MTELTPPERRIPPGAQPKADPSPEAKAFRRTVLPRRTVQADAHSVVNDAMWLIQRELQSLKGKGKLDHHDIRSVADLARTAKEIQLLQNALEEELGEELARKSDEELAKEAEE